MLILLVFCWKHIQCLSATNFTHLILSGNSVWELSMVLTKSVITNIPMRISKHINKSVSCVRRWVWHSGIGKLSKVRHRAHSTVNRLMRNRQANYFTLIVQTTLVVDDYTAHYCWNTLGMICYNFLFKLELINNRIEFQCFTCLVHSRLHVLLLDFVCPVRIIN